MSKVKFLLWAIIIPLLLSGCEPVHVTPKGARAIRMTYGVVNRGELNMRSGPGTNYSVVCRLGANTEVILTGEGKNGWVEVAYEDKQGYMFEKYLNIRYEDTTIPYTEPLPQWAKVQGQDSTERILTGYDAFVYSWASFVNDIPLSVIILVNLLAVVICFWLCYYYKTDSDDDMEDRLKTIFKFDSYAYLDQRKMLGWGYLIYFISAVFAVILCTVCEDGGRKVLTEPCYKAFWLMLPMAAMAFFASYNLQCQPDAHESVSESHYTFNLYSSNIFGSFVMVTIASVWAHCDVEPRLMHVEWVYDSFFGMCLTLVVFCFLDYVVLQLWNSVVLRLMYPINNTPLHVLNFFVYMQILITEYYFLDEHFFDLTYIISLLASFMYACCMLQEVFPLNAIRCDHCHSYKVDETGKTDLGYSEKTHRRRRNIESWSDNVTDAYEVGYTTVRYHNWLTHHHCNVCQETWEITHMEEVARWFTPTKRHWTEWE